jgi:preprotein translocase subunit SecD
MKITLILILAVVFASSCGYITGLFERGGRKYIIEVKPTEPDADAVAVTDETAKVLASRLDAIGIRGKVTKMSAARIEVLAYGKFDAERVRNFLLNAGRLELAKVVGSSSAFQTYPTREAAETTLGGTVPANRRILPYTERDDGSGKGKQWIIVENPPVIDGRVLRDASAYSLTGRIADDYLISFKLNREGAEKFGDWTGRNIGNYLAIVLNDEVKSAPVIKGQIFDSGQIEGRFTKATAEDLALILKSGYLPATLTLVDETAFED